MLKLPHNCTHLTSKVMLKILQARLQQYMNCELPDVQAGFRKGRGTRDQIANICWIIEKARVPEKHLFLLYWLCQSLDCVDHNKLWKILQEMGIPDHLLATWEICIQVKKQQLEVDKEQQTGSKKGKEYVKVVYCQPAYLISIQSTLCEMPTWMKHKLEARLSGEISVTSDSQMTPPLWQKAKKNERASWWKWKERVKKLA